MTNFNVFDEFGRVVPAALKQEHRWQFGRQHWLGRLQQQKAMQAGQVRDIPSIFGPLSEESPNDL